MTTSDLVKVICIYTPNTPYQQEVIALQSAAMQFHLPCEILPIDSYHSIPTLLLKKLSSPILFLEAGAKLINKPDLTPFQEIDFSARFTASNVSTSILFINKTKAAHKLLEKWHRKKSLYETLLENKKAKVLPLPLAYCKVTNKDDHLIKMSEIIIETKAL